MKFNMNKIAAAVAVSLGTSVVGMSAAQADEILFPYIVHSDTVTTIMSVINDDDDPRTDEIHYRYYYKSGSSAASNSARCQEVNYRNDTSPNDVVTFDIGGIYGDDLGVLFEPEQSNVVYSKRFDAFRNIKPLRGFAVLDNNDRFFAGQNLSGEAFIIEFANGASWGYQAYNASSIYAWWEDRGLVATNPYDFSDRVEVNGEVLTSFPQSADVEDFWAPIVVMPFDEVNTRLFVTPIGTVGPAFQLSGRIAAEVALAVNDNSNIQFDVMYDRDENPVSGRIPAKVVCVGGVDVKRLISQAAQQFVPYGGWTNVGIASGQAVVIKLEYNDQSPATLNGQDLGGWYNQALWLRKGIRESVTRVDGMMPVYDIAGAQDGNSPYPLIDGTAAEGKGLALPPKQGSMAQDYLGVVYESNYQ
ncbi:MAG: hypothetical protein CSA09_05175 [Candidatus Contendobacter odensis]|uniref:DUF4114 domain-containing protein n=1 Tax=Candidatus Contendibacter odensensis TaxID=1400860 RepID=A0A2G6PE31_9GAMM|nr:MAG: hypothetical protein CSA09_05175 [Candidatus Contendobacter odensis]